MPDKSLCVSDTIHHNVCALTVQSMLIAISLTPVQNGDGTIDFREYVIGVTILCRPANTEDVLRMAFLVRFWHRCPPTWD